MPTTQKFLIITLSVEGREWEEQYPADTAIFWSEPGYPREWLTFKHDHTFLGTFNPAFVVSITLEDREES